MTTPIAPVEVGLCRDERHRYFWNGGGPYPGVTSVLKVIYSFPLERWKLEGVARRALRDLDMLQALRQRGDEDAAIRLLLDSKDESVAARDRGSLFHSWAEAVNRGEEPPIPAELSEECMGYLRWRDEAKPTIRLVEQMVISTTRYGFGGTFDMLAGLDGQTWLLDIKTSKTVADRRGRVWRDMRMQLAAYAHAEFIGRPNDLKRYRIPKVERYGIVHVTAAGTRLVEAAVTPSDWAAFIAALVLYNHDKEEAA